VDANEIRELIELISRSNFATFELEGKDFRLKLIKESPVAPMAVAPTEAAVAPERPAVAVQVPVAPAQAPAAAPEAAAAANGAVPLTSPIVGTFYRAPSPEAPPFVEIGSKVNKGQVICIVEAMKVMNEIECEFDAEVVDVLVSNGQPVEYGETLFLLRRLN
jgi:acetyl-CoA carboxylase biotin carboxyl carrier protein